LGALAPFGACAKAADVSSGRPVPRVLDMPEEGLHKIYTSCNAAICSSKAAIFRRVLRLHGLNTFRGMAFQIGLNASLNMRRSW